MTQNENQLAASRALAGAMVLLSPKKPLICHRCGNHSIPAPPGSTSKTRYVCAQCSPAPAETQDSEGFDLYQFQGVGRGPRFSKQQLFKWLESETAQVLSRASSRVDIARKRGERWVSAVSRDNLFRLPLRSRRALLLTIWCGLTSQEAAEIMDVKPQTVRALSLYARKKLCSFLNQNAKL